MKWSRSILMLAGVGVLAWATGCMNNAPPGTVLTGTWQIVPTQTLNPPVTNWFLTFDADGNLTQVTYTFAGNAAVTWVDPPAATSVEGSNVYISTTQNASDLTFTGTLNSSSTVITGTMNVNVILGGNTITLTQAPVLLVKQ